MGSAYDDLLSFPNEPRRYAGFQLGKVQVGLDPDDWKPFDDVGVGTKEIRIREALGTAFMQYSRVRHFFAQVIAFERYECSKLSLQRDF